MPLLLSAHPRTSVSDKDVRWLRAAGWLAVLVVLAWHVTATVTQPGARWTMPDLGVYRAAVTAAGAGLPLYEGGFGASDLPWLYPPFALLVLWPLGALPETAARVTVSLASLAALGWLSARSWQATGVAGPWRRPLLLATFAVLLASEPMQQNLAMGQVNVVLAALVLTDVLLPAGNRGKGLLVGLAAGVKLTPALVAVYYLFRRDWAAARNAGLAFAATVVLATAAFPSQSWTFWTQAVLADRIGPAHLGNQSLLGAMLRVGALTGLDAGAVRPLWLFLAATIGLGGVWWLSRLRLDPFGTYCGLTAVTLLISPLSWTPHWIALTPTVIWFAARRRTVAGMLAALLGPGLLLFAWPVDGVWSGLLWTVYPSGYWPWAPAFTRTLGWIILGNLYLALATVTLGALNPLASTDRVIRPWRRGD